jgi:hypothetical protein
LTEPVEIIARATCRYMDQDPDRTRNGEAFWRRYEDHAQAALKALEDAGLCVVSNDVRDAGITWLVTHTVQPTYATPTPSRTEEGDGW